MYAAYPFYGRDGISVDILTVSDCPLFGFVNGVIMYVSKIVFPRGGTDFTCYASFSSLFSLGPFIFLLPFLIFLLRNQKMKIDVSKLNFIEITL